MANPYDIHFYTAVLSVGFFGLLHPGEMVKSEHALLVNNVYLSDTKVVCLFPTSKAHKGPIPQTVHLYRQPNLACPVTAMINYSKVCSPKAGQYFIKVDGTPITNADLANILRCLSQFLDLPHHHFKPHSLCIGGSTHLHLSRILVHKIRKLGSGLQMPSRNISILILLCSSQQDLVHQRPADGESIQVPHPTQRQVSSNC